MCGVGRAVLVGRACEKKLESTGKFVEQDREATESCEAVSSCVYKKEEDREEERSTMQGYI